MWLPSVILAVAVLGYPFLIAPARSILAIGLAALALCALGLVVRSTSLVTAGGVLALAEYALALRLAAGLAIAASAVVRLPWAPAFAAGGAAAVLVAVTVALRRARG